MDSLKINPSYAVDYIIQSCNFHINETYRLYFETEMLFKLDDLTTTVKAKDARLQAAIDGYSVDKNKLEFITLFRKLQYEDFMNSDIYDYHIESDVSDRQTFPQIYRPSPFQLDFHINLIKKLVNQFIHLYEISGVILEFILSSDVYYRELHDSYDPYFTPHTFQPSKCKNEALDVAFDEFIDDRDRSKLLYVFLKEETKELLEQNEIHIGRILFRSKCYTW